MNKSTLFILIILLCGFIIGWNLKNYVKNRRCYQELTENWNRVNIDVPLEYNNQQTFNKLHHETSSLIGYISCLHNKKIMYDFNKINYNLLYE